MKNITKMFLAACLVAGFAFSVNAQSVGINDNGASPNSKAMLDVSSTTKGFLPPRMSYEQRVAISSPPAGLIVWCTNCGSAGELQIYNGTIWKSLSLGDALGTIPDAPTIGTANKGNAMALVQFTAPVYNGGSPIIYYTATSNPGNITGRVYQSGSGTITVTGLTNGTAYTFTLTATNAAGTSVSSAASNSVTPEATVPGAPTIGTAIEGNTQASVPFTAPISNGGSAIISYTATSNPGNITGTLAQAGSGTITVTGLTNGIAYTFTVTATNVIGTGAASEASNSVTPFACGQTFTDSRDGKVYSTVLIGSQCWMKENLNIGTRINGTGDQTNNSTIEKYCYANDDANCTVYGGLYQWDEMMQYSSTPGVQGICPTGWHLPTDAEWTALTTYLGGESDAGGKMKETGTTHWTTPNTGATNMSGFTGLPGGHREIDGAFYAVGGNSYLWSSSEYLAINSYVWLWYMYYEGAYLGSFYVDKGSGFSVRCLKD